jgi:hypothetical protein
MLQQLLLSFQLFYRMPHLSICFAYDIIVVVVVVVTHSMHNKYMTIVQTTAHGWKMASSGKSRAAN